jgi:hypothetical protein
MSAIVRHQVLRPPDPRAGLVRLSDDRERLAWAVQPEDHAFSGDEGTDVADDDGAPIDVGGLRVGTVGGAGTEHWLDLEHPWRVADLGFAPRARELACVLRHEDLEQPRRSVVWFSAAGNELGRVGGDAFAWTPGGRALLVGDVAGGVLLRVTVDGGAVETLCELCDDGHPEFAPSVAMAPSGERVAFTCRRFDEGLSELWVLSREHGPELLTQIPGATMHLRPFWSPRGGSLGLLIVHPQQHRSAIVLVPHLRGEGDLVHESVALDLPTAPAWAPSARALVFLRAEPAGQGHRLVSLGCRDRHVVALADATALGAGPSRIWFVDEHHLAVDGGDAAHLLQLEAPL